MNKESAVVSPVPVETGQLVAVRKRPAIVKGVREYRTKDGLEHLVEVEYLDGYDHPASDVLLWGVEIHAERLQNAGWPDFREDPMDPSRYDAYQNSVQWTSLQTIQELVGHDQGLPLVAPWSAALQVEDYQLTPLLRALSMPRVSLLLADDVGLGKTIQAGLIATELIVRRRIRRILIVCPASLQVQWQEEMKEKFHLDFTILDSDQARRTQREMGGDVNPWSVHSRVITSMDYLRQEVIYQQFEVSAKKRQDEGLSAFAPWDLLVVDEAHNVTPRSMTEKSLRSRMTRRLIHWFEHRVFLTATPHNGYTDSFTGLLESLDPVRFIQKPDLSESDRKQLELVMVRRLKEDIDRVSEVPRFTRREVRAVPVRLDPKEEAVYAAMREYRDAARDQLSQKGRQKENMGAFIFSILFKRLLSSSYAFAKTWWKHVGHEEESDEDMVRTAIQAVESETEDDEERQSREFVAVEEAGSWLLGTAPDLKGPAEKVTQALEGLGWSKAALQKGPTAGLEIPDAQWDTLRAHFEKGLANLDLPALTGKPNKLSQERVILFTEYKDTQQYLLTRFKAAKYPDLAVRTVYGGMSRKERDEVKEDFNDEEAKVRILLSTEAASEGLNLQRQCRYVAHWDIPWNPMKLEQRNGRVDRHGQAREVVAFHYASEEDEDQAFLSRVAQKVNEVRNDLGSVGSVIDQSVNDYFWGQDVNQKSLETWIQEAREMDRAGNDLKVMEAKKRVEREKADFQKAMERFEAASSAYNLSEEGIKNLVAAHLKAQRAELVPDAKKTWGYHVQHPPADLRRFLLKHMGDEEDALPLLVFDSSNYIVDNEGRALYRPKKDSQLIRLGHPLTQRALAWFRRAMWGQHDPESGIALSRWTIRSHEQGPMAFLAFQFLLTSRNELQEVVQSRFETWWYAYRDGKIEYLEEPPQGLNGTTVANDTISKWQTELRVAWKDIQKDLKDRFHKRIQVEAEGVQIDLDAAGQTIGKQLKQDLQARLRELAKDMGEDRRERLRKKLLKAEEDALQLTFNPAENARRKRAKEQLEKRLEEADLEIWTENHKILQERLQADHDRYVKKVLPERHALSGVPEVTEVGVQIFVPQGASQ